MGILPMSPGGIPIFRITLNPAYAHGRDTRATCVAWASCPCRLAEYSFFASP
jgi:hypothetical protein